MSVPTPDLYNSNGPLVMPHVPIVLGTAGINSPIGTLYIEYQGTELDLAGETFCICKNGGSYKNLVMGVLDNSQIATKTRYNYNPLTTAGNAVHNNTQLTKAVIVWRGTTQELWVNGSVLLSITGADAIPVDEFDQIKFSAADDSSPWESLVNSVQLWSYELTTIQIAELTKITQLYLPPDLYNVGALTMPHAPIVLGTAGINSPKGTIYIEYAASALIAPDSWWLAIQKDGGSYISVNVGGTTITNSSMRRRIAYGTTTGSNNIPNDHSQLTKLAVVWRGTTQEIWINGVLEESLTGLDVIPVDEFDSIFFSNMDESGNNEWLNFVYGVKLWSYDLTADQMEAITLLTTTVKVIWVDSISLDAIGTKVYRDDVEIADVGIGVQVWYDDTAEPETTYKYEVQAYSIGDETTKEIVSENVKYFPDDLDIIDLTLLHKNSFEDAITYVDHPDISDPIYYAFVGTDNSVGFISPFSYRGSYDRIQYGLDDTEHISSIQTVTDPIGNQTKAFYRKVTTGEVGDQLPWQLSGMTESATNFKTYIKQWIKVDNNTFGQTSSWRLIWETKTDAYDVAPETGFRIAAYMNKVGGVETWNMRGDDAPGTGGTVYWTIDNTTVPFPKDEWFLMEYFIDYINDGSATGKVWWKINGVKVCEAVNVKTTRQVGDPITSFFLTNVYGSEANIEQWVDDIEIWGSLESLGPELVTEEDFDNGLVGWTNESGWTSVPDTAVCDGTDAARMLQSNTTVDNISFKVVIDVETVTSGSLELKIGRTGSYPTVTASGVQTFYITGDGAYEWINLTSVNFIGVINSISIKEVL